MSNHVLSGAFESLFGYEHGATVDVLPIVERRYEHDLQDLVERLHAALEDFPELAGEQVTVALDHPEEDRNGAAWSASRIVLIPADQEVSNVTLYHELGHLAIRIRDERDEDVPTTSEQYCSIASMARMPPGRVDEERVPYLRQPTVPQELYPEICQRALEYREEHRDYIKQCERWLIGRDAL